MKTVGSLPLTRNTRFTATTHALDFDLHICGLRTVDKAPQMGERGTRQAKRRGHDTQPPTPTFLEGEWWFGLWVAYPGYPTHPSFFLVEENK